MVKLEYRYQDNYAGDRITKTYKVKYNEDRFDRLPIRVERESSKAEAFVRYYVLSESDRMDKVMIAAIGDSFFFSTSLKSLKKALNKINHEWQRIYGEKDA